MRKLLVIVLVCIGFAAKAQNPVINSAPQKYLKWVRISGSLFSDSTLANSDSTTRAATTGFVKRNLSASTTVYFKIPAGTTIPYNYVYSSTKEPDLYFAITLTGSSTKLTTNGATILVNYNYTSSDKTTLASIDIYGNDDGTGKFNEDTYVRVQP